MDFAKFYILKADVKENLSTENEHIFDGTMSDEEGLQLEEIKVTINIYNCRPRLMNELIKKCHHQTMIVLHPHITLSIIIDQKRLRRGILW